MPPTGPIYFAGEIRRDAPRTPPQLRVHLIGIFSQSRDMFRSFTPEA